MNFYEKIRAIQMVKENDPGGLVEEQIFFTDDPDNFEASIEDFELLGFETISDEILENFELPDWFPMNSYLKNMG